MKKFATYLTPIILAFGLNFTSAHAGTLSDFMNPSGTTLTDARININSGDSINLIDNGGNVFFTSDFSVAIYNAGSVTTITNYLDAVLGDTLGCGLSTRSCTNWGILNEGSITNINNSGSINASAYGVDNNASSITHITNLSIGTIYSDYIGIYNAGSQSHIIQIDNAGTITGRDNAGINNEGMIDILTNTGVIGGNQGVGNSGSIGIFNNAQGSYLNGLSPATHPMALIGNLPNNYNIIINSTSNYGQLAVTNGAGAMAFNIYGYTGQTLTSGVSASSVSNNHLYQNVLTGLIGNLSGSTITATDLSFSITGAIGTYGGYSYALVADDSNVSGVWDLLFGSLGPSAADTQASLNTQARRLRSTFNSTMASNNFANMNTYDCNLFDKNNMCISAGGRYTNIDNPSSNNSAAVVVLGYKVNSNIRIGGFLDQSVNNNTPTGIQVSNKNPMMGAFAVWNKNADGLGYQIKLANAYQDKDVRSTRDAYGETGEAGTGKTNLNTQSYVGELSYAFNHQDSTLVRPYLALRYTNIKQDAYTETGVSTPLSYAKLGDRSTTALVGVKLNHALNPRTNLTASLGIEQDLHHKTDQLVASGVADLTSENFNNHIKRTRPVASAGAYYAVTKTQRLSGEVYYQQLPFQSTGSATAYVNYMIGF